MTKSQFQLSSHRTTSGRLRSSALKATLVVLGFGVILLSSSGTEAMATDSHQQARRTAPALQSPVVRGVHINPDVCRDSKGRFASCGSSFGGWFDAVPRLRIPSISINLGRIIPSVSIGSPVRWGFKVPFSYTPRIKFMKFQVYFDPDFDYFTNKAGWITLAAFKAVGNQATVKSQTRPGTQKYRVYGPSGGGYESFTSPTSKKTGKGLVTEGTFTVSPNPIFEDQSTTFSVQLTDKTTARNIYLLTQPSCDGTAPWISKVGPGSGWNVVGRVSDATTPDSRFTEIFKNDERVWEIKSRDPYSGRDSRGRFIGYTGSSVEPIVGVTSEGAWSHMSELRLSDNGRCFAAIAPASGKYKMWVSQPVKVVVNPRVDSTITTPKTEYQITSSNEVVIDASVTGGVRVIQAKWCDSLQTATNAAVSASNGTFRYVVPSNLPAGTHKLCLSATQNETHRSTTRQISITVSRTTLSGSVSISTTAINTGQQFTVSGSITPNVAGKYVWIRVMCSSEWNYPSGWASQTTARPAHSTTGQPTGYSGLSDYNYNPISSSITSVAVDGNGAFSKTFTSNTPSTCIYGAYVPQTDYHTSWLSDPTSAIVVSRTTLSGSVSISTTAINTGQQFTVSGSITPNVAGKYVWIRVMCSSEWNYPSGWASQTTARPAHSTTGQPTGYSGLSDYNYNPISSSITSVAVDGNGAFSKTFTSNTPSTCIYGAYVPQTDYHTSWLSDPTSAIVVS